VAQDLRSTSEGPTSRRRLLAVGAGLAALLVAAGTAGAVDLAVDTEGHTTLEQILAGDRSQGYGTLHVEQVSEEYLVRDPLGIVREGREGRRRSLAYVTQLTDFQLADEESPARVEFADEGASSAWRPWEALGPFLIDASIRQVNRFAGASPVPQGDGTANAMDFSLMTGDQADNQQRNETIWVRELLEGGRSLNFNSGSTDPLTYARPTSPSCAALVAQEGGVGPAVEEARGYTGVQDFDDYDEGPNPYYYDPDDVRGSWASDGWPTYTGLMDRAQQLTLTPAGIDVPFYVTNGNHDVLVQGNEDANQFFERVAVGCEKTLGSTQDPSPTGSPDPDPSVLEAPSASMLVPPDEQRQFVSKLQIKDIYGAFDQDDDHGFGFVDPAENAASAGSASYYAWDPPETPGMRFISIDTNSEGGVVEESSSGNIDNPQFRWLEDELQAATEAGKLIVLFGHHPVRSMTSEVADEAAAPCTGVNDSHEHDVNPGCDLDPRPSPPLHLGSSQPPGFGESFVSLLNRYPNVITYIAGHTHENNIDPFTRGDGSVWWSIETSAVADWSQQSRLIEVMDNRDGTLSIFGTILDHASPATAPAAGNASGFDANQLASIGRTFSFNDPQSGAPGGEGSPEDRNVELLVRDPRRADLAIAKSDSPDPVSLRRPLTYTLEVGNNGPSAAPGVRVTDDLPGTVNFNAADSSQGSCSESGGVVTCELGELAAGAVATVTIEVTPTRRGTITNVATVDGALTDPDGSNDSDSEETTVRDARPR
jgi:uncharacterized repeat protein (TIGR01451 family)